MFVAIGKIASAFLARIASAQWVALDSREERNQYRGAIWDMLVDTYREIGVKLSCEKRGRPRRLR